MESNQSNRTITIAIVAAVIALLIGLCAGALVGGVAGYALGQAGRGGGSFLQPELTPSVPLPSAPGNAPSGSVTVQDVVANSPAEQAGIQAGDLITAVDSVTLDATHTLAAILAQHKPGDRVRLTIQRGGATNTVTVRLAAAPTDANRAYLGIRYSSAAPANPTPAP